MTINNEKFLNPTLEYFYRIVLLVTVFVISLNLSSLYSGGDNNGYISIYGGIKNLNIVDAFYLYNYVLTTVEFVHFFLIWVASNLSIDRVLFLSISNTFLAALIIKVFDSLRVNFLITCFFILTNYYLYVILFTAERLKFGFIFFLLFYLAWNRKKKFAPILLVLSVFSHLQMLILCLGKGLELFIQEIKLLVFKFELKSKALLFLPLIVIAFIYMNATQISGLPYIFYKVFAYGGDRDVFDFLRMGIFFFIALSYSIDKKETIIYFLPLFVAIYLVGGDRVNMIGYIFCMYYCLPYRSGFNLGVLITSLYFLYVNIDFVSKIFLYGNGFPPQQ